MDGRPWAVFETLRGVSPATLPRDLAAGLTLAAIAIPEQMATARLGGLPPEAGLVAFVAATLGFVVFGANRQLSVGADSTIAPIFAGSLAALAVAGTTRYGELAAALALMVGAMLALAGLFRLGWVADLLSGPVTTGFLAGIALHILISQLPAVLGVPGGEGGLVRRLQALAQHAPEAKLAAIAIGLGVLAVTFAAEKLDPRIPGALIALALATLASVWLRLSSHGVAVLGAISGGAPRPAIPLLNLPDVAPLVGLAAVIALVVMVQTAATSRSFPGRDGDPDIARDYIGVGVAGLFAGVVGAFPVNASPPRTATVAETGGRSQVAGLFAVAVVLALLIVGGRLLAQTPIAALAGVLLFVAQRIFHVRDLARILRLAPAEFALAVTTTVLIVVLPIQTGVAIGMFLSLAHGVFAMTQARLVVFERIPGSTVWWPVAEDGKGEREPGVLVVGFQAPLSFLNAHVFRRDILAAAGEARPRLLVLEASNIAQIDYTAAQILREVITRLREAGTVFAVARLESVRAQATFARFGVTEALGEDHLLRSVEDVIRSLGGPPTPAPEHGAGREAR